MYYNQSSVKQVDVPSTTGTFGILAQHVPLLAALKPGVITVTEDDGTINKYFGMCRRWFFTCLHIHHFIPVQHLVAFGVVFAMDTRYLPSPR